MPSLSLCPDPIRAGQAKRKLLISSAWCGIILAQWESDHDNIKDKGVRPKKQWEVNALNSH
jgi:hypothetical protein